MAAILARISDAGQIPLPADIRAALGLEHGGAVKLEVVDVGFRVRKRVQTMDRARAMVREITARQTGLSVDDFLADRRHSRG